MVLESGLLNLETKNIRQISFLPSKQMDRVARFMIRSMKLSEELSIRKLARQVSRDPKLLLLSSEMKRKLKDGGLSKKLLLSKKQR